MDIGGRGGVQYVVNVSPADLGARVVVRYRLPGGGATDVLGELTGWSAGRLEVLTRTGPVTVAEADLLAAKRIPPAPPRR
ncbi:MAG: hypothetical protein JWL64_2050 [Frankiales bacterium]|nr:hypothetical protein [Frankiales bacterium]